MIRLIRSFMTSKTWIIFSVLCVAVLGGLIAISQGGKINLEEVNLSSVQAASKDSGNIADHVSGNAKSTLLLIEYGDYQCPGCGSAHPVIKQLTEKYKEQLGFVFRNYPLTQIHPNALAASSASEAAGLQGKFWEMHDKLYGEQDVWKDLTGVKRTDYFISSAKALGLDSDRFTADLDSDEVNQKIDFDIALGKKANVTGTPTFYLNDQSVGDKYVKDGKLVSRDTDGSSPIWTDADAFEKLILIPALKEKGIKLPE